MGSGGLETTLASSGGLLRLRFFYLTHRCECNNIHVRLSFCLTVGLSICSLVHLSFITSKMRPIVQRCSQQHSVALRIDALIISNKLQAAGLNKKLCKALQIFNIAIDVSYRGNLKRSTTQVDLPQQMQK